MSNNNDSSKNPNNNQSKEFSKEVSKDFSKRPSKELTREFYRDLLKKIAETSSFSIKSTYSAGNLISKEIVASESLDAEAENQKASSEKKPKSATETFSFSEENPDKFVLIETIKKRERLVIFGGGHIAFPLVKIGKELGFEILVYDDRPKFASAVRFPDANTVICDSFDNISKNVSVHPNDVVVIVTRGHAHDSDCLRWVLSCDANKNPKYIGMIGSKRRVAIVFDTLIKEGFDKERVSLVHSPIGLDINAITPAEISISIFAEIVKELKINSDKHNVFESFDNEVLTEIANEDSKYKVLITVVYAEGSTPRTKGAKMLMAEDGAILGSIGGGCSESQVLDDARFVLRNGGYKLVTVDLAQTAEDDGMVCGGEMKVLIEKI